MPLTSGMAKVNLAILIRFISETFPNRFLDAANICTDRLQLVLRHNESILCLGSRIRAFDCYRPRLS